MDENAHDWKEGTEALALCMICGAEYEPDTPECPECHVSLSVVRRCPECQRMVSAQHTRCVYCRTSFTHELPQKKDRTLPPPGFAPPMNPVVRAVRIAVVSVGTFAFVFLLGIFFLREMNRPANSSQIVARSHALRSAKLLHSPSSRSSIAGMVSSDTPLDITGVRANEAGRWMVLKWKDRPAYLPASEMAAPLASEAEGGAAVLKFFIEGANSADAAEGAAISVRQYAELFPKSPHGDELRWLIAERLRNLARRGGKQSAALKSKADEQYKLLAASKGSFAAQARDALRQGPATDEEQRSRSKPKQIEVPDAPSRAIASDAAEQHQIVIVTEADVFVHPDKLSNPKQGNMLTGTVAQPIQANGILAVPAGAPCRLQVVSTEAAATSVKLLSIEIDKKVYTVQSSPVELRPGETALNFHLREPLVIER